MQIFRIFKNALIYFERSTEIFFLNAKKIFLYMLLLSAIMAIPPTIAASNMMQTFTNNFATVAERMPDFQLKNQEIQNDDIDPFIVNTDYVTYAYDPNNENSQNQLNAINANAFKIINTKDRLILDFADQSYGLNYTDDFTAQQQKDLFTSMGHFQWAYIPIAFLIVTFGQLVLVAFIALLATMFTALSKHSRRLKLKFSNRFRLVVVQLTVPAVVVTIINLFTFFPYHFEIMLLYATIQTIRLMKRIKVTIL
ncbi:DUF1189 family protein [Aerococcus kribbianus]|uniref:DUF1189 family protein n=1 Tax=Aerococcus kribbianus TaxID=2999064 RepID=A0A9X3FMH3_9LACT|nr:MULTISPECIES: DUF1189 family protein [unclassified Aerococcus]MCZ0717115.1 DUF1189 family protein [Aerococcus sp. YH-aer221]MCZ0725403.1 DUF1189 family protein [Aerococcus sp. YH-aer222]